MSAPSDTPPTTVPHGEVVLLWDFFGPTALGTARHFLIHLDEFLAREGLGPLPTGVGTETAGHVAAWCQAPSDHEAVLVRALRPKRKSLQHPPALPSEAGSLG
jgi:hypothetical protein